MSEQKIDPQHVTKPIQLLAAWLVGLIVVDSAFLTAAGLISSPTWIAPLLSIAAVANVPLFLVAIFLLQTKFRPEMQEDTYYSKYLEMNTRKKVMKTDRIDSVDILMQSKLNELASQKEELLAEIESKIRDVESQIDMPPGLADIDIATLRKRIEQELTQSLKLIEKSRSEAIWSNVWIELNDLLPDYQYIRNKLEAAGATISSIFGTSSLNPEVPSDFVLSFSEGIDAKHLRELLKTIHPIEPDYLAIASDPAPSIYLGSYIYTVFKEKPEQSRVVHMTKFDTAFRELLYNDSSTTRSVHDFMANSKERYKKH